MFTLLEDEDEEEDEEREDEDVDARELLRRSHSASISSSRTSSSDTWWLSASSSSTNRDVNGIARSAWWLLVVNCSCSYAVVVQGCSSGLLLVLSTRAAAF